jgi:hypothetical protein
LAQVLRDQRSAGGLASGSDTSVAPKRSGAGSPMFYQD